MAEDSTSMLRPETHATIRLRNDDDDLYFIIVTKCIWPLGGGGDRYPITGSIVHVSECLLGSSVSLVTGW